MAARGRREGEGMANKLEFAQQLPLSHVIHGLCSIISFPVLAEYHSKDNIFTEILGKTSLPFLRRSQSIYCLLIVARVRIAEDKYDRQ